jgi:membrane-bound serine protease (ClpP class)
MRINGTTADEKYLGAWREEFAAIAEDKGRDPEIAKAFVDRDIEIPGVVEAGKLLTLTPQRAVELGMADTIVNNREDLLEWLHAADAELLYSEMTVGERVTRIITHPNVAPVLLSLGILCLVAEFFTAGIGVLAVAGIFFLSLYFGGHMIAGMASWFALLLFLAGLILCFIEILTPSFGVFALGGIACIVGSIFLTTPDLATAIKYVAIVLLVMVVCAPIFLKLFSKSKLFERLLVKERLTTEDGYIAGRKEQADYIGKVGVAATTLRPAGAVELEDGTRLDVVTRGEFIEKGEPVRVIQKDGTWLVVEKRRN